MIARHFSSFTRLPVSYGVRCYSSPRPSTPKRQSTVCIHNVPPEALIGEVLDIVLTGPIFHVQDLVQKASRSVRISFYDRKSAIDFLAEVNNQPIILFDRTLKFSWVTGPHPPRFHPTASRTIQAAFDKAQLTADALLKQLTPFGPIDRLNFVKGPPDKAFISFLSARTVAWAVTDLRKMGVVVGRVRDRCVLAGLARTEAHRNRSCRVILRGFPRHTTLAEIVDQVRGGALHSLQFRPDDGVAYVHFLLHASAATFFDYALYRGITLHGRRLHVQFEPDSRAFSPNLAESIANGASRALSIHGLVSPQLLAEISRYGPLERVSTSGSISTVVFVNIVNAINAFVALPKSAPFRGVQIRFDKDPCSRPLLSIVQAAATVQKELQTLLSPGRGRTP
ncbi:hypothetical protein C8F01DRAFT_1364310 [Mycena amicta]|nr:hypothetical protein C8F01DRAFT_1364310 [Mycena amicta]